MTDKSDQSTIFILYGATGDLARRMVLPAFYGLAEKNLMPSDWRLVGNGRKQVSDDAFRKEMRDALDASSVDVDEATWDLFAGRLHFAGNGFSEENPGDMLNVVNELRDSMDNARIIHYLAVPPESFRGFTAAIKKHGLDEGATAVFEKPYGTSPDDFEELDKFVHTVFDEADVFRIDHFLGKEAAQNLHAARFGNRMLADVWNREHVAAVQIDIPETLDIDDRAVFYDHTGALLDMIVTHLFQLAAEVAMEEPASSKADDLADARETVIDAFRPLAKEDVVLGQFEGYTDVEGVAHDSKRDTYVAARLWVDTDRWHGVPFLLRTGKMMAEKAETITLIMKDTPNAIRFDLAGTGAIDLALSVKQPGPAVDQIEGTAHIELGDLGVGLQPYERLIHDAILGDKGRFTRPDGLRYAWRAITPLLKDKPKVQTYAPKTWGPEAGSELFNNIR